MATPSAVVYFEYTTIRVSSDQTSHTFCCFACLQCYFLTLLLRDVLSVCVVYQRPAPHCTYMVVNDSTMFSFSKCFTTVVLCGPCAVVRGNPSQVQTAHLIILDLADLAPLVQVAAQSVPSCQIRSSISPKPIHAPHVPRTR